jgi:hemerythrin
MKEYIPWDTRFELGIPKIDFQHKKLVSLCNVLYNTVMEEKTKETQDFPRLMLEATKDAIDYTKYHFGEEEKILRSVNMDLYLMQKSMHGDFVLTIMKTVQEGTRANFDTAVGFATFLKDWVFSHIATEDRKYVPTMLEYIKQNGELAGDLLKEA